MKPSIIPIDLELPEEAEPGPIAALGRRALLAQFKRIQHGELRVLDGSNEWSFGTRNEHCPLSVTLEVLHPQFYPDAAFGGTVGAGAAYIRGLWRCSDLTGVVRLMVVNRDVLNGMDSRWSLLKAPLLRAFHWLHRNSPGGSARNIAAHYDLGNDLYRLMLDETMAYSCGIFANEATTLVEASRAKFDMYRPGVPSLNRRPA